VPSKVRISMAIDAPLLDGLDRIMAAGRYTNRSEFIRDMVRDQLVQRDWREDREALATITLLYKHDQRGLSDRLSDLQHHHHKEILVTTHIHLDERRCAEVIVLRGKASRLAHVADELRKQRGVLHAALSISSTGEDLP
jgi:CopG family transcriptional regulator, nickel-responsive regulator